MFFPNAETVPLNPRPAYRDMIVAGSPEAFGRVVELSEDRRLGHVIWRGTPGTYRFQPDPAVTDTCVVLRGKAHVRVPQQAVVSLTPGSYYQFPREAFEMEIVEEFVKVSFLYNPAGLKTQVEPL